MTEEEIPESQLLVISEHEFYKTLKGLWKKLIIYFLVGEAIPLTIGTVVIAFMRVRDIKISLPLFDNRFPVLSFSEVATTVFQASISFCGIILGFFAICFFFMLRWGDERTERYTDQIRKTRSKKAKSGLKLRQVVVKGAFAGLSQYAELFVSVVIILLASMIMLFVYCLFSGFSVPVNIIVDLNALLIVTSGIWPLMSFMAIIRKREREIEIKGLPPH